MISLISLTAIINVFEGNSIDYLAMIFDFSSLVEVSISMGNMVTEFLQKLAVANDAHAEPFYIPKYSGGLFYRASHGKSRS